jgi:hypothetical protein
MREAETTITQLMKRTPSAAHRGISGSAHHEIGIEIEIAPTEIGAMSPMPNNLPIIQAQRTPLPPQAPVQLAL